MIPTGRSVRGGVASLVTMMLVIATLLLPAVALAQEYQKVDEPIHERLPHAPFVAIAYGFIWLAVLAYVAVLGRKLARVQGDIEEVRRKLDAKG